MLGAAPLLLLAIALATSNGLAFSPTEPDLETSTLSRIAQTDPVANPLTTEDVTQLFSVLSAEDQPTVVALIRIQSLLDRARFDTFVDLLAQLASEEAEMAASLGYQSPDVFRAQAELIYDEVLAQIAESVRGCAVWLVEEDFGVLCVGSMDGGFSIIDEDVSSLAECVAAELCTQDAVSYPGHTLTTLHTGKATVVDGEYLFVAMDAEPGAIHPRLAALVGALDAVVTLPRHSAITAEFEDPTHLIYGTAVIPEQTVADLMALIRHESGRIDDLTFGLDEQSEALGAHVLRVRATANDDVTAQSIHGMGNMALGSDPSFATSPGNALTLEGTVVQLDFNLVTTIGIFAAIGIPAYVQYVRRSQTTEATMNMRRLYDSSVAYYDSGLGILQFPASTPLTPPEVPCGETVASPAEDWSQPTWSALSFELVDPHRFSYQYDSNGTGLEASFTASAFGDLDCDGVYSTFMRTGTLDASGEIRGGAGLYQSDPTE